MKAYPLTSIILNTQPVVSIDQLKQSLTHICSNAMPIHIKISLIEGIKAELKAKLLEKKKQIALSKVNEDKTSCIRRMASVVTADSSRYLNIMNEYLKSKKQKKNKTQFMLKIVSTAKAIRENTSQIVRKFERMLEIQQEEKQIRIAMLTQLKIKKTPARQKGRQMALTLEEMYEGQDKENRNSLLMNR